MIPYTYRCPTCNKELEVTHRITEEPHITCDVCVSPMIRYIHPVASHFKGGGWASDLYVNKTENS